MIKKKKGGMAKRYANSYASRDSGSSSKGGVINYRNHDGEIKFFSPAEGKNRINIVPYVIKSKNHPLVKSGEAEVGEKDYVLDFYAHRGVGPAEKTVLCLKMRSSISVPELVLMCLSITSMYRRWSKVSVMRSNRSD